MTTGDNSRLRWDDREQMNTMVSDMSIDCEVESVLNMVAGMTEGVS